MTPIAAGSVWALRIEIYETKRQTGDGGERAAMKETTSSSANDPRLPSAAKPYVPPTLSPQDLPIDYAGFLAVVFGVVGVTLRVLVSLLDSLFVA